MAIISKKTELPTKKNIYIYISIYKHRKQAPLKPISKHKKAIRHSVGITVSSKNNTQQGLRLFENLDWFIWFWLKKSDSDIENGIFLLCGAYTTLNKKEI